MPVPKLDEAAIFDVARHIDSADFQRLYIEQACGNDDDLRTRLDALLRIYKEDPTFLERPADGVPPAPDDRIDEGAGRQIGPYRLVKEIGEGGFGKVFMAEQCQPVQRMVALKIVKPGMDTRQVIARFESERQSLALMRHPNIAQIIDGGETASGRPYFVMELVQGVPITDFCDRNRLGTEPRLKLFVAVCHAIQHAHHKGVIHRDIKPSNIMVTLFDQVPVVKVIDFGVAKATARNVADKTLFTSCGQMIGTPAYMSPEQAEMSGLDIDTRSDVYSLGVLVYELLTGSTPIDSTRLRGAPYDEMQRLIREEDPPPPSARLLSLGASATVLAANRGMEPKPLARMLAGDLDCIVMKTLEKDRNRRYSTPGNIADEVERYLRREPILARPPSASYRLKRFAQRHRGAVLAVAAVTLALLVGTTVATWQAVVATRAKREARLAAASEKKARDRAELRESETRAALDFVENKVFSAARPKDRQGLGPNVSLREAVEAALPFVKDRFTDQPLIEARLRLTLGRSFWFLGDWKTAAEQYHTALTIYRKQSDQPNTLKTMAELANSYQALGKQREALELREEVLATRKATLGPDHLDTIQSMAALASSYYGLSRPAEAAKMYEATLALRTTRLGPDHPETLRNMHNLANSYYALGRRAEALELRKQTLKLLESRLGPTHLDTLLGKMALANSYSAAGRQPEAITLFEETLELEKSNLGAAHPHTLSCMNNLANSYSAVGRLADALKLRLETLELQKASLGDDHPETLHSMSNLANTYVALNRPADAIKLCVETLELQKAKVGPDDPETLRTASNLAIIYSQTGRPADALTLHEDTLARRNAKLGPEHPDTLVSILGVAGNLMKLDRGVEAVPIIDNRLRLAAGKGANPHLLNLAELRLRFFARKKDAVGCRTSAELWEKLQLNEPSHLLFAARYRAVTSAVLRASDTAKQADAEADRAMVWLHRAVTAGYASAANLRQNKDLETLRDRADFRQIIADLEARL
jgi:eukaryotic-like serine/threonine-protein kinase